MCKKGVAIFENGSGNLISPRKYLIIHCKAKTLLCSGTSTAIQNWGCHVHFEIVMTLQSICHVTPGHWRQKHASATYCRPPHFVDRAACVHTSWIASRLLTCHQVAFPFSVQFPPCDSRRAFLWLLIALLFAWVNSWWTPLAQFCSHWVLPAAIYTPMAVLYVMILTGRGFFHGTEVLMSLRFHDMFVFFSWLATLSHTHPTLSLEHRVSERKIWSRKTWVFFFKQFYFPSMHSVHINVCCFLSFAEQTDRWDRQIVPFPRLQNSGAMFLLHLRSVSEAGIISGQNFSRI